MLVFACVQRIVISVCSVRSRYLLVRLRLVSFAPVSVLKHLRTLAEGRTVPLNVRCWLLPWKPVLEARKNYVGLVSSGKSAGLYLNTYVSSCHSNFHQLSTFICPCDTKKPLRIATAVGGTQG